MEINRLKDLRKPDSLQPDEAEDEQDDPDSHMPALLSCPWARHSVHIKSCSTTSSLMEINNVSHESLVHAQGHTVLVIYASEMY